MSAELDTWVAAPRSAAGTRWTTAWATCHGWVALELCGINFAEDLDAGYEALLELLLRGLAPSDVEPSASGQRPSRSGDSSIEV